MKCAHPITMRQVAQAAGFAVSTVSKALRNDPTIPEARCREIQALARRLGYRPNPMVATLMAQLHHRRRSNDPHNIAWIDLWPSSGDKDVAMGAAPILRGARERAQEMGYGIEVYPVTRDQMSPERLRRVLTSRGQWGL
ncbi:MAG TPA: LacI family DNA-binding transcriptional regulator, partial [Opitutaceae bacterium]|nr:LacI family DNA-binding transcriptional regulator [Opitutaceae bacterium]